MFNILKKSNNMILFANGNFVLKSGKQSNIYVDLKKMISRPDLISDICNYIKDIGHIKQYDYILGVPYMEVFVLQTISVLKIIYLD